MYYLILPVILTGCVSFPEWTNMTFYQADNLNASYWLKWRQNIRTTRVYNGFSTTGIFDILLIPTSAPNHGYVFYVLAYAPYMYDQMLWANEPLNIRSWQISLQLGPDCYRPSVLTPVALPGKYQLAFGNRFNKHKQVYLIGFDLKSQNLINNNTDDSSNDSSNTSNNSNNFKNLNHSRYLQHNQSSCAAPETRDKLAICKQVEQELAQIEQAHTSNTAVNLDIVSEPKALASDSVKSMTTKQPEQLIVSIKLRSLQQSAILHWAPGNYQLCDQANGECDPAEFLLRVRK